MGIPYSREINAAFEQVTPLVAAGFKVLRTTKNISILLAAIQVLTVFLLFLILLALLLLIYSVNPDLEAERREIVTPALRWLAKFSVWALVRSVVSVVCGLAAVLGGCYYVFLREGTGLEGEGDRDADRALEDMDEKEREKKKKDGKKNEKKGDEGGEKKK